MSLFYSAHDVFATYTRICSSVRLLVNEEFFYQSSFYLSNFVHQCRGLYAGGYCLVVIAERTALN